DRSSTDVARMDRLEAVCAVAWIRAREKPPNRSRHPPSIDAREYAACMRRRVDCRADDAAKRARREFLLAALPVRIKSGPVRFRGEQSPALSRSRGGHRRSVLCGGVAWPSNSHRAPLLQSSMFPSKSKLWGFAAG